MPGSFDLNSPKQLAKSKRLEKLLGFRHWFSKIKLSSPGIILRYLLDLIVKILIPLLLGPRIVQLMNDWEWGNARQTFFIALALLVGFIVINTWTVSVISYNTHYYRVEEWVKSVLTALDLYNAQDIRCTVWSPIGNKKLPLEARLYQQISSYHPDHIESSDFLQHGEIGRLRYFTKKIDNHTRRPVGIIGQTIKQFSSIIENQTANYHVISRSIALKNLDKELTKQNYNEYEKTLLAPGRLSYLTLVATNYGSRDILAIVYFDSNRENRFSEDMITFVAKMLPRLSEIMVSNRGPV